MHSELELKSHLTYVHLGCTEAEREFAQKVNINVVIEFSQPPAACRNDKLQDTICYKDLTDTINQVCTQRPYHLIENLCFEIFQQLKLKLSNQEKLQVQVHKVNPPIPNLLGGTFFTLSDRC